MPETNIIVETLLVTVNKPTLTVTRGLPGAGKSTWATQSNQTIISRDSIRFELFDTIRGPHTSNVEESITQEQIISDVILQKVNNLLTVGTNVVLDSMNADPVYVQNWKDIAVQHNCCFNVVTFLATESILNQRNLFRPESTRVTPEEIRLLVLQYPNLVLPF